MASDPPQRKDYKSEAEFLQAWGSYLIGQKQWEEWEKVVDYEAVFAMREDRRDGL